MAWLYAPVEGALSGGNLVELQVLASSANFPLAVADAAPGQFIVGAANYNMFGTGGYRTAYWNNPFLPPDPPPHALLDPPGSLTGGGPYYWLGETSGINNSGLGVGWWRGYDEVYSSPEELHESTGDVTHAVTWDLTQPSPPSPSLNFMEGPASLLNSYWWNGSTYLTRLMSRARKVNNAGIIVGQVWDYLSTEGFPKAVAWIPGLGCFTLDELFPCLATGTSLTDAFDISDDNIIVATLQTPTGVQRVALRLPMVP